MKTSKRVREIMMITLGIGLSIGLWKATEYRGSREMFYNTLASEMNDLQCRLNALRADRTFMREHHKDIKFLTLKKWSSPENRLIAGECIEEGGRNLSALKYTFEPAILISLENGFTYKVTKIIIDLMATLDTDVYIFIEKLTRYFPGILHISEVNLALNTENPPPYIKGTLVFNWYTQGEM